MNEQYIIGNGWLVTLGDNNQIIENGAVYIEHDIIMDFGKTAAMLQKYPTAGFLDAKGKVIMPGMINTHHHLYSTFACGLSTEPAANFVEILEKLWWRLDKALSLEDVYYSAMIPLIKCIKAGTTTIIDHHASPKAIKNSLFTLKDAVVQAGIRANLCYEVTDRGGRNEMEAGIAENIDFIKYCQTHRLPNLAGLFGLHASMTLSSETLQACVQANQETKAGFHIHVAEDKADLEDSKKKYGKRLVPHLHDAGLMGENSIFAHCIHIDESEMDLISRTKTNVVHNPQSNMNNSVGCADVLKLLSKGVLVGLGTDGMTSNMFEEDRFALLIQHHVKGDPRLAFCESIDLLTRNNAKIAGKYFPRPVGLIEKGAFADVILVEYSPFTPFSANNFYGHFMFGLVPSRVHTTIVGGKILMENFELKGINEQEIAREAAKLSPQTWQRF
jgi:putative selenium metabolism protein SsnA